ncbi:L-histidine N(alpha)-methyltransferase, partial [Bordetella bronchiseptica]
MAHTPTMLAAAAPFMPEATGVDPALDALLAGLQAHPARIDPKYLYDALGSSLFAAITQLPEYYPTRCEAEIFATHLEAIARHTGPVRTLIDLGAGDCAKAERLLPCLRPQRYVPIDISTDFLGQAVARVRRAHPWLDVLPLGRDLNAGLDLP